MHAAKVKHVASTHWHAGFCRATEQNTGDCNLHAHGSWSLRPKLRFGQAATQCQELCQGCNNCRYISLSLLFSDCSWYAECDLSTLKSYPDGFHTSFFNGSCGDSSCLHNLHHRRQQERVQYEAMRLKLADTLKKRHAAERAFLDATEAVHTVQREMMVSRQAHVNLALEVQPPSSLSAVYASAQPAGNLALGQRLPLPSYYKDDPFVVRGPADATNTLPNPPYPPPSPLPTSQPCVPK